MLFTALTECKHQLLHKLAGTTERPASKQMEVILDEGARENKAWHRNKELSAECLCCL